MTNRYSTPQEGSLNWHVPLNENFDLLDKHVEIRDTAANRDSYDPASGAKFLATDTLDVYLGDGDRWTLVGNLGESGGGGTATADGTTFQDALSQGNLVAVGSGSRQLVDRSATSTPVQDAIDYLASVTGSGRVFLPPGETRDSGPITIPNGAQGIHIQGTGISTATDNGRNCVVTITGSNPGLDVKGWGWKFASMDGFTLKGTGQSHPAIRFRQSEQWLTPRMFNIGRLRFNNWKAAPNGVLHYENSECFSCHFDTLMFSTQNTGPCFDFDSNSPLMLKITNLYADHYSPHPVFKSRTQSPGLVVDMCNVGGDHTSVLDLDTMTALGFVHISFMNWEPSNAPYSTDFVNRLNGPGYVHLPHTAVTGYGGGVDVGEVFRLGSGNGNNFIGQIQTKGDVNIRNNYINVTSKPRDFSWYFGSSSEVQNSTGSNTGRVRTMAAAGRGNA